MDIQFRTQIRAGDIGYIVYLHGVLYAAEHNLDLTFEGYVAAAVGEFAKSYNAKKDYLGVAELNGRIVGSIAIVGISEEVAQLRWFLVHPEVRGHGVGRKLVDGALSFSKQSGYTSVFLWTVSELETAAHIYKSFGFQCTEQRTHEIWGALRTEQRYELKIEN